MSDIQNDTDLKPSDHILDDWLTEHGMAVTFDDARKFLGDLREAFGREESAPRPVIDREALFRKLHDDGCGCDLAEDSDWMRGHVMHWNDRTKSVMELARPMPTQAELTDWLREIFTADPAGTPFGTAAEELLALLNGSES